MREAKNRLGVAVRVGRMDITFNDIVVHQSVDDIGTFAISCAYHQRMPEEVALINKGIGADTLALPKILERPAGVEAVAAHLKFLAIAGGMKLTLSLAIEVGQLHRIHGFDHGGVGGADVIEREAPVDGVIQLAFRDA